ncbi:MAG: AMP-binding protein, partial [Polyangiaceae bacterium]|nr:AMP-binding protein [Polyangiaceae bacterium]
MTDETIKSVSRESRVFAPSDEFAAAARIQSREQYDTLYRQSLEDPEGFWREQAKEFFFYERADRVLSWEAPHARWFEGATTNLATNCLDRHVDAGLGEKVALIWEGEPGEVRKLTYRELTVEVSKLANALLGLGVERGDRVGVYMGMVPEAAISMLACARIGAVHTVIFGGFAADAVRDRLNDAAAKVVITQDGAYRRGQAVPLKAQVDSAIESCPTVEHVIVLRRTGTAIDMREGRDLDYHDLVSAQLPSHEPVRVDAEHPLFILYTSGTTGHPKGVLHTTAGYMVGAGMTTRYVFDLAPDDVYFCTADVGWVTGHSYIVYGPLLNATTVLLYEGAPNAPDEGRMWSLIERHKVTIFYTAPTAIRAFVKWGEAWPQKYDLSSLRLLGTVGEPINPEAWMWYRRVVGGDSCPIVDTWWQT